ncbi:MAG: D-beta-hydroxybutyrate permease, partial [uncultured Acetobacteraceae bacterium]
GPCDRGGRPGLPDVRGLPRLQRDPVRAGGGDGGRAAHGPRGGAAGLHRRVHGQDGRLREAVLPRFPARRRVRQGDRTVGLLEIDRGGGDRAGRAPARHAGHRAGLRGPDLRRRVAVRGGVRGLPLRGGDVQAERHPEAAGPRHHRARRLHLHHGFPPGHPADPEHHPHHLLPHRHLGGARPGHHRLGLHPRRRPRLPRMAPPAGGRRGRRLRRGPHERAGAGRRRDVAAPRRRHPAPRRGRGAELGLHLPDRRPVRGEARGGARGHGAAAGHASPIGGGDLGGAGRAAGRHPHGAGLRLRAGGPAVRGGLQGRGGRRPAGLHEHRRGVRLRRGHRGPAGLPGDPRGAAGDPGPARQRGGQRHGPRGGHGVRVGRHEHRARGDGRPVHRRCGGRRHPARGAAPGGFDGERGHGHAAAQRGGDHAPRRHRAHPPAVLRGHLRHHPDQDRRGVRGHRGLLPHRDHL